jgi:hypothetical protein
MQVDEEERRGKCDGCSGGIGTVISPFRETVRFGDLLCSTPKTPSRCARFAHLGPTGRAVHFAAFRLRDKHSPLALLNTGFRVCCGKLTREFHEHGGANNGLISTHGAETEAILALRAKLPTHAQCLALSKISHELSVKLSVPWRRR